MVAIRIRKHYEETREGVVARGAGIHALAYATAGAGVRRKQGGGMSGIPAVLPLKILATAALCGMVATGCGRSDSARSTAETDSSRTVGLEQSNQPVADRLSIALDDPDAFERARLLGELLPQLGPEALPEVRAILDRFRVQLGAVEFELLVRFWAGHEPEAATLWTFKHASPLYRASAARTAVEIWASQDPAAALVAVESSLSLADEEVWRGVQMALIRGWFDADRAGLERYMQDLGVGFPRQRALFAYVLALAAREGSAAVIRWAESIPDDDAPYKRDVYRQTLSALAWGDMDAAVRFCDRHCDGPHGGRLRVVLIRTRLRDGEDGARIMDWIGGLPAEDEEAMGRKKHELDVAYGFWAHLDRPKALKWMEKRLAEEPRPDWLKFLFADYARQLAADSPADAIQWAEKIDEPKKREITLIQIARRWIQQDESAAEAWLEQSPLSELARQQARDTSLPDYLPPSADTADSEATTGRNGDGE